MSDDKILFSILEIGYCSHMMYRAKYMLVSLHLCTSSSLPPFPSPVGNKWPFCNCIPLSWFFTLYLCSMCLLLGEYISWKVEVGSQGNSGKKLQIYATYFFSDELLKQYLFRIDLEVSYIYDLLWLKKSEQRGTCVTSEWSFKTQCAICHIPFSCLGDNVEAWVEIHLPILDPWVTLMSRAPLPPCTEHVGWVRTAKSQCLLKLKFCYCSMS